MSRARHLALPLFGNSAGAQAAVEQKVVVVKQN